MHRKSLLAFGSSLLLLAASAGGMTRCAAPEPLDDVSTTALYDRPTSPLGRPLAVFHLGHSLVGHDMPAMLAQLSGDGHRYKSQLGWGTPLKAHWGDAPVSGFDQENTHAAFQAAKDAVTSGEYDAVVLTEMVEVRDAIKHFQSADYVHRWARLAWEANPDARLFLYETWHRLDDPEGWIERLDRDLGRYWEHEILRRALAYPDMRPIYVIPAGQVLASFVREVEAMGGIDGIAGAADLFARDADGRQDMIHLNDKGAYLVALTHYAVIHQSSPVGLPHELVRADASRADALGPEAARLMQEVVWDVVTRYPKTGVAQMEAHGD
jgi:hypothetical protein